MESDLEAIGAAAPLELTADCERCCALCCAATSFSAGEDFAIDKAAHVPCPLLTADFRCSIHDRLHEEGFRGCAHYDCYGAGQKVVQHTFGGDDWRARPELATKMFETFMAMRELHELLMYLSEALKLETAKPLWPELRRRREALVAESLAPAEAVLGLDVDARRRDVHALLRRVGDVVRSSAPPV
ncbi:MAG: hypothetical protein R3190_11130 [Thermoanaerobaculia bacterium]|nr:hypothetical protein [Thermoanaerobaculia bacterium]